MKTILAAIDFSDVSDDVIRHAVDLSTGLEAKIVVIHVAAPDPDFVGYDVGPPTVRDARADELHEEHRHLHHISEDLRSRGIPAKALLIEGPTVAKILEESDRVEADFIVMGSHGRSAVLQVLLGSVTQGVIRSAQCPVIVVPARR